jgi:hypothetical protein
MMAIVLGISFVEKQIFQNDVRKIPDYAWF